MAHIMSYEVTGKKSCLLLQKYFNKTIAFIVLKKAETVNEFYVLSSLERTSIVQGIGT